MAVSTAVLIASVLSAIKSDFALALISIPSLISFIISLGSSSLGLSEVTITLLAYLAAIAPILGLLLLSLFPPHPKTQIKSPCGSNSFNVFKTFSNASGV